MAAARSDGIDTSFIKSLPSKKTLVLIGLGIITFFVYPAHYAKNLSDRLNAVEGDAPRISPGLTWAVLISSYLSLAFLFGYFAVDEDHPIARLSNVVDRVSNVLFIFWSFSVRARVHELLKPASDSSLWFHGFWTFFFSVFYINYKVNQLKDSQSPPALPGTV